MDIIGTSNVNSNEFRDYIQTISENLISANTQNKDVYSVLKAHTKDSNEMSLVLLTERKFLIQIIKTLVNEQMNFENLRQKYEILDKKSKFQISQIKDLNNELINIRKELKYLDNTNSKLLYSSFIKEMRDFKQSKSSERLSRHKSRKYTDSELVQSSLNRCDSLSKMIVKLSKSCDRDISVGTEARLPITKPNNLYYRREDINT